MAAVADHLWQSIWFALPVGLWALAMRGGFAITRYGLWCLCSVKFLAPLGVLRAFGAWHGCPVAHAADLPPAVVVAAIEWSDALLWPAAIAVPPDLTTAGRLLLALWIAGSLLVGARWFSDWRLARTALRLATPVAGGSRLDVRTSLAATKPLVVGLLHPVLLLPDHGDAALTAAQRRTLEMFAQEYLRRRFHVLAPLQRLAQTLFWFAPVVWCTERLSRPQSERACDQTLIAAGADRIAYADGIIAASRLFQPADGEWARRGSRILRDEQPRSLGFIGGLVLTAWGMCFVLQPLLSGAVRDRLHRHEILRENERALRFAPVTIAPAAPGMGARVGIDTGAGGTLIRNASVQDLLALAYGVGSYEVLTRQMQSSETAAPRDHWIGGPRYDVRVDGAVREPESFDAYALRAPLTRALVERFGFEIHLNGDCQPPCGKYDPSFTEVSR